MINGAEQAPTAAATFIAACATINEAFINKRIRYSEVLLFTYWVSISVEESH